MLPFLGFGSDLLFSESGSFRHRLLKLIKKCRLLLEQTATVFDRIFLPFKWFIIGIELFGNRDWNLNKQIFIGLNQFLKISEVQLSPEFSYVFQVMKLSKQRIHEVSLVSKHFRLDVSNERLSAGSRGGAGSVIGRPIISVVLVLSKSINASLIRIIH